MNSEIKYHPLVDADTEGTEKVPMFFSTNEESVSAHHKLYLEEIIPHYYRLCSSEPMTAAEVEGLTIHCPLCNKVMRAISSQHDGKRHALYQCDRCQEAEGRYESSALD